MHHHRGTSSGWLTCTSLPKDPEGERAYDEFALARYLRVRGWVVPAYTMAPKTENLKMLRVVVREDFTRSRCESLITDVKLSMQLLEKMDKEAVKRQQDFIHKHHLHSSQATHNHPQYKVRFDKHRLDTIHQHCPATTLPSTIACKFLSRQFPVRGGTALLNDVFWLAIIYPSLPIHHARRSPFLVTSAIFHNVYE